LKVRRSRRRHFFVVTSGDARQTGFGRTATPFHPRFQPGIILAPSHYFGFDGIRPFVDVARDTGRGLFVLVQTSNESAGEVQGLSLPDGTTVCQRVGNLVQGWALEDGLIGKEGYSCIGAVVSPRDLASTDRIRKLMPNCVFLVPGFGAQGRSADEVGRCFKPDGTGAVVTASRSVIYAYDNAKYYGMFADDWRRCIEQGCIDFVEAIRSVASA